MTRPVITPGRFARRSTLPMILLLTCPVIGRSGDNGPPSTQPVDSRQRLVLQRMEKLEGQMLRLSRMLTETEPEKAERLRDALAKAGEKRVRSRMDSLTQRLAHGEWSEAEREQELLLTDLDALLTLLTDTSGDLDRKRLERQQLEALRRAVQALQQEQSDHVQRTKELEAKLRGDGKQNAGDTQPAERGSEEEKSGEQSGDQAGKPGRDSKNGEAPADQARDAELKRAIRRLEALQRKTQEKTENAQQQAAGGKKSDSPDAPSRDKPGAEQLKKAAEAMRKAADRLGEQQPDEAQGEQREALDELQQALDDLDDALRQIRQEEMEETLAALEGRFRSMLEREKTIREEVLRLYQKGMENWSRRELQSLSETAAVQQKVAEDCGAAERLLTEEGTTVVLPDLVSQLRADMTDIAGRLQRSDVSAQSQRAIDDVIDLLEEILGAIERQRNENQDQPPPPPGDSPPPDEQARPLLPGSAELKLLRSSQLRVNRRTAELAAETPAAPDETPTPTATDDGRAARLGVLSARQRQLGEMARRMNERK
ncbi:MAG: hypothetical protein U1D55_07010 [Phycisphaerae bacterium]